MPTITSVEAQKHDPERVNVYLDGSFGFGASRFLAVSRGLRVGHQLTSQEVAELGREDAADRAYAAGLNYLSFRPRSRREMEQYYRRRATEPEAAQAALARLERNGLLDDLEFARFWVDNRQTFRPRSRRALKLELRHKGLDNDAIEAALETMGDEESLACDAGRKRMRSFERLGDDEFLNRMVPFLQRRGFPYAVAAAAARSLAEERGREVDADALPPEGP